MSEEGLPLLRQKIEQRQLRTGSTSSLHEPNPSHLKREVQRLYPRIQQIEKDIASLRMQVPTNLNKTILTLSQEMERLRNRISPNSLETTIENEDLSTKLAELESRLLLQLEVSIQASSSDIEKRLSEMVEKPKKEQNLNDLSFNLQQEAPSDFDSRINSLQQLVEKQQRRNQQRLTSIENSLTKLTLTPSENDSSQLLHQLSSEVELHKTQLAELTKQIEYLESNNDRSQISSRPEENQKEPIEEEEEEEETKNEGPSNEAIIQEIQNDISDFKNDFIGAIGEIKTKAEECDSRMDELEKTSLELVESTKDLDARVTEAENLAQALQDQIQFLAKKVGNDQNKRIIDNLSMQIQSAHENMRTELEALKIRIKKCELSTPLFPKFTF